MNRASSVKPYSLSHSLEAFNVETMRLVPKVLWIFIFSHFNRPQELGRGSLVCRHWNVILEDRKPWTHLIKKLWPYLSSCDFDQPKIFMRTQLCLTPDLLNKKFFLSIDSNLFSKLVFSKNFYVSTSSSSLQPTPTSTNQYGHYLCDEINTHFLRYSCHKFNFTLRRCCLDESGEAAVLMSTLDLSFLKGDAMYLFHPNIKLCADVYIIQARYTTSHKVRPSYVDVAPLFISGYIFLLVHKDSLSFIAHVEHTNKNISDYGLTEDGKLYVCGKKGDLSVYVYDLFRYEIPKSSLCFIF